MDTDTNIRIAWAVRQPATIDATFLIATKYEWTDRSDCRSWYLTLDGWEEFSGYDLFDEARTPHLAGAEQETAPADWWVFHVVDALDGAGFHDQAMLLLDVGADRSGQVERRVGECPAAL